MGIFNEKGSILLTSVMSAITAIFVLWDFTDASEVQKYFGTTLLLMIPMFFVLVFAGMSTVRKNGRHVLDAIQDALEGGRLFHPDV